MSNRRLAELKWSPYQRACFIGVLLGLLVLAILDFLLFSWLMSLLILALFTSVVFIKVIAVLLGLISRFSEHVSEAEIRTINDQDLPVYTILLPLYKESEVVENLVKNLGSLDYPKEKLDVKLLLEKNDEETLEAVGRFEIPSWCELVMIPDIGPKTKPRACNYGLECARGEFLVIYDAEDRPEKDQLKKSFLSFQKLDPEVVCLQAKLNFFNSREGLLARWFTLEYTAWFDLYLPGLHAIGSPIPLGGTSNHFRIEPLKKLDGWDPYNVTEDCDLGIRIFEEKYKTRILDSTTWEEAPLEFSVWVGQRSRWVKGYFQTFWVHTRNPIDGLKRLGVWGFLMMLITVGGQVATLFVNPLSWLILAVWGVYQWPLVYKHSPYTLILFILSVSLFQFNFLFIFIHLIGAWKRKMYGLMFWSFLLPFYWLMVSVGAWKGVFQFFWAPYKWVKTRHGLSSHILQFDQMHQAKPVEVEGVPNELVSDEVVTSPPTRKFGTFVAILLFVGLLAGVALRAPHALGFIDKMQQAEISLKGEFVTQEHIINSSWFGFESLTFELPFKPKGLNEKFAAKDFRLIFYVKVGDEEWYQQGLDQFSVESSSIKGELSLLQNWEGNIQDRSWGRWSLRRVREFGVKVFGDISTIESFSKIKWKLEKPYVSPQKVTFNFLGEIEQACKNYEMFEIPFELNKEYENPFDPDEIDLWGVFQLPSGEIERIPAFYYQKYHQYLSAGEEVLRPLGQPSWMLRYTPKSKGQIKWHVKGEDKEGLSFISEEKILNVSFQEHKGYLGVGSNPRYFAFENKEYFYPVALNIRSPRDERNVDFFKFDIPKKEKSSYAINDFISEMKKNRINMGRIWMSPWFCGLEWNKHEKGYHGLGRYNLMNAFRVDGIMTYAKARDILIEVALNHHGPFTTQYDSQWKDNPYFKKNGGPANSPKDILTQIESKRFFKNRLRYIAARYGAYTNLFAYILWIEANVVDKRPRVLSQWHKEFAPFMKEIDLNRHLVTTEFNNYGYKDIWQNPDIEYTQVASYNQGRGLIKNLSESAQKLLSYNKPAILEEYGGLPSGGSMEVIAHEFHDGLWLGWVLPIGGSPMPWWWNFLIEKNQLRLYSHFNNFIAGENLSLHKWQYISNQKIKGEASLNCYGRVANDRAYFWIYSPRVSNIQFGGRYRFKKFVLSKEYKKRIGDFNPVKTIAGMGKEGFLDTQVSELTLKGSVLQPGSYVIEYWDTWNQKEIVVKELEYTGGDVIIKIPPLKRDLAIKIRNKN